MAPVICIPFSVPPRMLAIRPTTKEMDKHSPLKPYGHHPEFNKRKCGYIMVQLDTKGATRDTEDKGIYTLGWGFMACFENHSKKMERTCCYGLFRLILDVDGFLELLSGFLYLVTYS